MAKFDKKTGVLAHQRFESGDSIVAISEQLDLKIPTLFKALEYNGGLPEQKFESLTEKQKSDILHLVLERKMSKDKVLYLYGVDSEDSDFHSWLKISKMQALDLPKELIDLKLILSKPFKKVDINDLNKVDKYVASGSKRDTSGALNVKCDKQRKPLWLASKNYQVIDRLINLFYDDLDNSKARELVLASFKGLKEKFSHQESVRSEDSRLHINARINEIHQDLLSEFGFCMPKYKFLKYLRGQKSLGEAK